MGQSVAAIVYGVPMSKECDALQDDDGEWLSEPPLTIETGGVCDFRCLGLTIAVQNVPEDDEIELPEGPIGELPKKLRDEINLAKDDWKQIVAWAKSHKVKLGKPELLLVNIERA